jgi:hypothetical protein
MKTIKILQLIALTLALALADAPRSQAVTINWITDTSGAFDVVITGTGLWSATTLTAPNGYWAVGAHVWFQNDYPSLGECAISNGGDKTTYLGTINGVHDPFENLAGYADYFSQSGPVRDGATFWNSGAGLTSAFTGLSTITINSMPDPHNASTWTWTEEVTAQVVPEPGTLSLCIVGFGLFAARRLGRRGRFAPSSSKL